MFGVFIFGVNLQNTTMKVFDVKMFVEEMTPLMNMVNVTEIPMVPCTEAHINFNDKIKQNYYPLHFHNKLCPPLGQQIDLIGKVTSNNFTRVKVTI